MQHKLKKFDKKLFRYDDIHFHGLATSSCSSKKCVNPSKSLKLSKKYRKLLSAVVKMKNRTIIAQIGHNGSLFINNLTKLTNLFL